MKHFIVFVVLILPGVFCFSQVKTNFTQQDYDKFFIESSVPKDLKKDGHILMVWTPFRQKEEKDNAEIKTIIDSFYKGKFVICPLDYRKLDNSDIYKDTKIYKYKIMMTPTTNGGIHMHYSLSLVDNQKIASKETEREAIIETGLEDAHKKLNKMLAYYVERLNAAKD
jgi:hypothetical protein